MSILCYKIIQKSTRQFSAHNDQASRPQGLGVGTVISYESQAYKIVHIYLHTTHLYAQKPNASVPSSDQHAAASGREMSGLHMHNGRFAHNLGSYTL